ncbi:MAG: hypothetical protein K2Q03_04960, partial [Sphingobacteriaceae bacterium]|nr:hypothetical protein [Sphingobacteriaceae bacterium]
MKDEIFLTSELPSGKKAVFYECKAKHFFKAMANSSNAEDTTKCLIMELVKIEDCVVDMTYIDNMSIGDFIY